MRSDIFSKSSLHNAALFGRLSACCDECEKLNQSTTALDFVMSCSCLANPDRTEVFQEFVTNVENYLAGKAFDLLSMLSFIAMCKDLSFDSFLASQENQRRYESTVSKFKITQGILLAWDKYLLEVDNLWAAHDNEQEYWTQDSAVAEVWNTRKKEIRSAVFDPASDNRDLEYTQEDLERIQEDIRKASEQKFSYFFRKYLDLCRDTGKTLAGNDLSPKRKNAPRTTAKKAPKKPQKKRTNR